MGGYRIGPNIQWLLGTFWGWHTVVPQASGYHGRAFRATRGVTQGDIISLMIFNLVLDCIIKAWKLEHPEKAEIIQAIFYADNELLQTDDAEALQEALDEFTEYFLQVGLQMNAAKTNAMVMIPGPIRIGLTSPAYRHRMTGEGGTAQERWALKVPCPHCQIEI
jgi:Reverse transcriptase (RNA-dependent DNA polymerase)